MNYSAVGRFAYIIHHVDEFKYNLIILNFDNDTLEIFFAMFYTLLLIPCKAGLLFLLL